MQITHSNPKTLIIAEAGVNHNGDLDLALQLVDAAANCGADIVKFQSFKSKNLVTSSANKASYQSAALGNNDSQLSMLQDLELSYDAHLNINEHCKRKGINFLSTAFDLDSINLLKNSIPVLEDSFW